MAIPAIVGVLSSVLGTAMGKQQAQSGAIRAENYANNAKTVAQLMKGV